MITATVTGVTGHDASTELGLDDGSHLAVGHCTSIGHPGDDADVAGCIVVENETAVAGGGRLYGSTGRVGCERESEHRAREHHRRYGEQRQGELAGVEIGHTL